MSIAVPAILPSSREDFKGKVESFARIPSVERMQIDVVDGKFAEPASWPYTAPEEIQDMVEHGYILPHTESITYEVDLMCVDPERATEIWLALGATRLTFHAESVTDLPQLLAYARKRYGSGANFATSLISFGIALNVTSDLALVEPCLDDIEYVQLMGIAQIGRQGEPFDERVFEKVRQFRSRYPDISLQIDGGVSLENAKKFISLGVENLIVGSALTRADNPAAALAAFENLKNSYGV